MIPELVLALALIAAPGSPQTLGRIAPVGALLSVPAAPVAPPLATVPSLTLAQGLPLPAPILPAVGPAPTPAVGVSGPVQAKDFNNAYGFYGWISELAPPEDAARLLLGAFPLIERGAVFVMKEGGRITVLSVLHPDSPAIVMDLSALPDTPQARVLSHELELAAERDRADGGFFHTAAVMARLGEIARAIPREEEPLIRDAQLPIDPVRRPREHLERIVRDAMRSEDPYAALDLFRKARREARERLNYGDAAAFSEDLFRRAEFKARQIVPELLLAAQRAAGDCDRAGLDHALAAAYEYVEYAPGLKARVQEAHKKAAGTLDILERYGAPDRDTGLPSTP
jgi:hypothetical protein